MNHFSARAHVRHPGRESKYFPFFYFARGEFHWRKSFATEFGAGLSSSLGFRLIMLVTLFNVVDFRLYVARKISISSRPIYGGVMARKANNCLVITTPERVLIDPIRAKHFPTSDCGKEGKLVFFSALSAIWLSWTCFLMDFAAHEFRNGQSHRLQRVNKSRSQRVDSGNYDGKNFPTSL